MRAVNRVSQCCKSSGISKSSDGAGRWAGMDCQVRLCDKAHCIESLSCHGNPLVQERSFPRIGNYDHYCSSSLSVLVFGCCEFVCR